MFSVLKRLIGMRKTKTVNKVDLKKNLKSIRTVFFDHFWEESWTYIKTVVDIVREPVLILDKDLRVLAANDPFYQTFQVKAKETERKIVYELGNGQWDIAALRQLLEDILPKNTFFKGFEVIHDFPLIGRKVMILNARQIHFKENTILEPIILLAIEDITEIMGVADMLTLHTNQFEERMAVRTEKLEVEIKRLEKEIIELKNQ
jgi:nitrogen-specific signal transduction histidine kinase